MTQSAFVSGAQAHGGRLARLECFLPTRSTEAPAVAGFQAAKTEFRHRCRKIVAAGFGKLEKRGGHDGADRVATDVISPSVAAAVSKEPRHWAYRADFEPLTEHVTGCARPTASITVVVPQHCRLRVRCCRPTTHLWPGFPQPLLIQREVFGTPIRALARLYNLSRPFEGVSLSPMDLHSLQA